jgi:hypothetical protein
LYEGPPGRILPVALMESSFSDVQEDLLVAKFERVVMMMDGDEPGGHPKSCNASFNLCGRSLLDLVSAALPLAAGESPF